MAVATGLPAVVHNRESDDAMLEIVREPEFAALRADFHSFAGKPEMLDELLTRGHCFGFSGMVTFAKADNIRTLLAKVPDDRILVETDTPFLAPAPHRGKPNRTAWAALVGERVASLETCLAQLEKGGAAAAFASGMAATSAIFQSLEPGAHVILPNDAMMARSSSCAIFSARGS